MSIRGNVLLGKCTVGKVSFGEVSGREIVRSEKCLSGKCPSGRCQSGNCPRGSVSRGTAQPGNCPHTDRTGFQERDITKFKDKIGQMRNLSHLSLSLFLSLSLSLSPSLSSKITALDMSWTISLFVIIQVDWKMSQYWQACSTDNFLSPISFPKNIMTLGSFNK